MTDRRQDHQRSDGPGPHRQARQLRGPEDQGGDHACGRWPRASACRPARSPRRRSPTRRRAPPTPTSPIATGNPMPAMPPEALAGGLHGHRAPAGRDPLRRRLRGRDGRRPRQLPAGDRGRSRGRGQEGQAQGRHRPDQGLARPLRRQRRLCLEPGAVRRRSTRPRSTTCSGSSRCRTWSTITTGRRTRPASRRSPQMAEKAIDILAKNPEGYVLLIEGGRDRSRQPCRQCVSHAHRRRGAERGREDRAAQGRSRTRRWSSSPAITATR